jgi:asparagine synthase (glutamine-hydrolysing)
MRERERYHGIPLRQQLKTIFFLLLSPRILNRVIRKRQAHTQHDWLGSELFRAAQFPPSTFNATLEREGLGPIRDIGDLCVAMTQATSLPMLLHYEDRNSMAHSVEARVPFLDHRLVEFSIGLGARHKIVGGDTKRVLRRAMKGIMPQVICERRDKLGFATPEQHWFRGALRSAIEGGVEDTLKLYPGLLNPVGTRALVREMLDGGRPLDFTVWRIVNIGIWGRVFNVSV